MVMKKSFFMLFVQIARTRSQQAKSKVAAISGRVECKKYPLFGVSLLRSSRWRSGSCLNNNASSPLQSRLSTDVRIAALEENLGISSQPKEGDVKTTKGETSKEQAWGRNRGNPMVTYQESGVKCKEHGWLLGSSKKKTNTCCVEDYKSEIYFSMWPVCLSAHNSLTVVKIKVELGSHADTWVVGDHGLVIYDHKKPVNVFWYDSKAGSRYACIVNAIVFNTEPETGQVDILLIKQAIEIKVLDYHILCPMQWHLNGVFIDEVTSFWHSYLLRPHMSYR